MGSYTSYKSPAAFPRAGGMSLSLPSPHPPVLILGQQEQKPASALLFGHRLNPATLATSFRTK